MNILSGSVLLSVGVQSRIVLCVWYPGTFVLASCIALFAFLAVAVLLLDHIFYLNYSVLIFQTILPLLSIKSNVHCQVMFYYIYCSLNDTIFFCIYWCFHWKCLTCIFIFEDYCQSNIYFLLYAYIRASHSTGVPSYIPAKLIFYILSYTDFLFYIYIKKFNFTLFENGVYPDILKEVRVVPI